MKNEPPEIVQLRKRAEAGDADAQYELGCKYYNGDGVGRDYAEALKWYRKAAAQGHNSGLCDVAYCYRNGHGVKQDYAKAIPCYQQAANQGCPTGAYWLAFAYEHGQGVKPDMEKAKHWYEVSRDRGDSDAAEVLKRLGQNRRLFRNSVDARLVSRVLPETTPVALRPRSVRSHSHRENTSHIAGFSSRPSRSLW